MTNWLIILFFGSALIIGVYFTWILLRSEMDGRPKPPPVGDDFGFATPTRQQSRIKVTRRTR